MKDTGILRQVDKLGRIVLPMELRKHLDVKPTDAMEIYLEEDRVILKKYDPSCIFCHQTTGLMDYKGKKICSHCLAELKHANS